MKKTIYTALMAAAMMFAGCGKEIVESPAGLQLKVTADGESIDKIVKSESAIDVNTFEINLEKKDGKVSMSWVYGEMPSLVELSPGEYTVTVSSPSEEVLGWETPVYGAVKDFEIVEGTVTPAEVICTLQNMKNSVYCSQHLIDELTTYEVKVANQDGFLVWSADEVGVYTENENGEKTIIREPAKHAYFTVASLTVNVNGYREVDGTTATLSYEIKNVAARDHHILFVDAYVTGESQMSLSIDGSVNDNSVNIMMPGIDPDDSNIEDDIEVGWGEPEDEPEIETPEIEMPAAPSVVWEANPDFQKLDIAAEMDVELTIFAPAKIKGFIVHVSENFLLAIQGLVPGAEYLDLIGDKNTMTALRSILPVGEQLLGQTEVSFSLSTLVPLIAGIGNPGEDYVFTLEVTDELDQKLVKALEFYNPVTE